MTDFLSAELSKGHWPIILLVLMFGLIYLMLRQYVKINDVRHKDHEIRHKEHETVAIVMSENLTELKKISAVQESRLTHNEDDISEIKQDIRSIRDNRK